VQLLASIRSREQHGISLHELSSPTYPVCGSHVLSLVVSCLDLISHASLIRTFISLRRSVDCSCTCRHFHLVRAQNNLQSSRLYIIKQLVVVLILIFSVTQLVDAIEFGKHQ
jgi:hypothetical protein